MQDSANAVGATHLALTVDDIGAAIARFETAGWQVKGFPQCIPGGPGKGTWTTYFLGPDHVVIESMQPPAK